jgi:hypothetical protein
MNESELFFTVCVLFFCGVLVYLTAKAGDDDE